MSKDTIKVIEYADGVAVRKRNLCVMISELPNHRQGPCAMVEFKRFNPEYDGTELPPLFRSVTLRKRLVVSQMIISDEALHSLYIAIGNELQRRQS